MKPTKTKWLAAAFLALVLVVSACSGGKGKEGSPSPGQTGGESPTEEVTTFTWFSADPIATWNDMNDEVGQEIIKRTGVKLEAEFAMDENRIALMVASNEYPDLISPKGDASKLVDAGALIDLRPLIEEHGPNLKKVYGEYLNRLRWSKDDEAIYILPSLNAVGHQYTDIGGSFHIQHAAVKEAGYPQIRTVQDFENVIRQYVEKHPTIDGQPTIGITFLADGWRILIGVTNPAFITTGAPDDGEFYIDPETYEVTYHYRRPPEKEYFRWLNHLNATGLLDPEAFVQKEDQYKAKIASGRVVGIIDQTWGFNDAVNALKSEGKFERTYAHFPVTLTEEYKDHALQDTGFMAGWGIGITTACKDPVKAIKFLDWLASDEGQVLINWGIEDKHYKVDENGKRYIPEDVLNRKLNDNTNFTKETGIGMYNISARYGDGVLDPTGNYYTTNSPDQVIANYHNVEKETLAQYGVSRWIELWPQVDEFPVKPWGAAWNISYPSDSELAVLFTRIDEIMKKRIPQIILSKPSEFDRLWDEFMQDIEAAGVEKMEDLYEQYVKERIEHWNG